MNNLVGKTVSSVDFVDPWDNGLKITFSDGTTLEVKEAQQAGEIKVLINKEVIKPDLRCECDRCLTLSFKKHG